MSTTAASISRRDRIPGAAVASRVLRSDLLEMQAIIASGFGRLPHGTYWLLRVTNAAAARDWLRRVLASDLVRSVARLRAADDDAAAGQASGAFHGELATLAFTYRGLRRMGIRDQVDAPFPTPFRAAMTSPTRRRLLGDGEVDDWLWGDMPWRGHHERHVDVLLAHYRQDAAIDTDSLLHPGQLVAAGFSIVHRARSCPSYAERKDAHGKVVRASEPFGFADGIGQPVVDGLPLSRAQQTARQRAGALFDDRVVAPGEFILGHRNEYGELSYCPDVVGWRAGHRRASTATGASQAFGTNGTYLAVRQIWQDVAAFRAFEQSSVASVEKMIGRRRDGSALITQPAPPVEADAFRYRVDDAEGLQCPRGAHARRANPRDSLGWDVSSGLRIAKLHRLLRRGRVFAGARPPCEESAPPPCGELAHRQTCGEGLFFMALNANLERQFEFVQQRWINNHGFGDLVNEVDPAVGRPEPRAFSMPGLPVGQRIEGFSPFTRTIGGGYFFVPSLSALRFIAREA